MALLSRSLRAVRRTPDEPSADDNLAPPAKRQRTTQENGLRRRRSSPDCLDTTTLDESSATEKARANPPLKAARARTSTRHARRPSASSIGTDASAEYRVNGNGVPHPRGQADREIAENASATDLLRRARESPDPLDMISQVDNDDTVRARPRASSDALGADIKHTKSSTTTRVTRHSDRGLTGEGAIQKEIRELGTQVDKGRLVEATRLEQKPKSETTSEPPASDRADGRRSLRSADTGSRSKSELAQYFFNYEQIISLEKTKPEFLAANTIITLVNDLPEPLPQSIPDPTPFGNPLKQLHDCEVIELSEPALRSSGVDPLNEEVYFRAHRKFERQEKQLRNIERDRAQHEQQQVERLLEELRSSDWPRVMGLTGVHESEKKLYEPKRQILIQELVALVTKFQTWKDEERRRKLAKDKPLPVTDAEESQRSRKRSRPAEDIDTEASPLSETPSTPDSNDVDAWAARQLHQEARSASAAKRRKSISGSRKPKVGTGAAVHSKESKGTGKRQKTLHDYLASAAASAASSAPIGTHKDEIPSTSSPEDSDSAASPADSVWTAHTGPSVLFRHRPRIKEREFEPPPDLLTEEAIQASQRQRRRLKRHSGAG